VPLVDVLPLLLDALHGRVLLAHHAPVEVDFVGAATVTAFGVRPPLTVVDTLALEHRLRADVHGEVAGSLRLDAVRRTYGLPRYSAHHALTDAAAAAELLLAQVAELEQRLGREDAATRKGMGAHHHHRGTPPEESRLHRTAALVVVAPLVLVTVAALAWLWPPASAIERGEGAAPELAGQVTQVWPSRVRRGRRTTSSAVAACACSSTTVRRCRHRCPVGSAHLMSRSATTLC
jgi:hypothetical protein